MITGRVIGGEIGKILIREKSGKQLEIGELLIVDSEQERMLMQVYGLMYGSQLSQQNLELISGMSVEEGTDIHLFDQDLRNYTLAVAKTLIGIKTSGPCMCKKLPAVFSAVRDVTKDDLSFLTKPRNPLFIGNLRSGTKELDIPIFLDGEQVLSHHILIPATTGRGKSNLTSCIMWNTVLEGYCGMLVLDPHDEYYGRTGPGLKDHPNKDRIIYYTARDAPPGTMTLKIDVRQIRPEHFNGVVDWSGPQKEALMAYNRKFKEKWIEAIIFDEPLSNFHEGTLGVIKRRMLNLLHLSTDGERISAGSIFDFNAGKTTIGDIVAELEKGNLVIIDTSTFSGAAELLVGTLITTEVFNNYRRYASIGALDKKPVVSVVLEEAPRVLGKDVLEKGPNIFSTIAREGRKFKVGLLAITQLPSLIPKEVLANINTKIILGVEMKTERQAIIDSAAQDLSNDEQNIAGLDKGEAIITSNFARFATPVKIPLFDTLVKAKTKDVQKDLSGIATR